MIPDNKQIFITALLAWVYSAVGLFLSHFVYIVVMNIVPYDMIHDPWVRASIEPKFLLLGIPQNLILTGLISLLLLFLIFVFKRQFLKSTHFLAGMAATVGAIFANTQYFGESVLINLFIFWLPIAIGTWLALSWVSKSIASKSDEADTINEASTS